MTDSSTDPIDTTLGSASGKRRRMAEVIEVIAETADSTSIVVSLDGPAVSYRPGQFLTLRIPSEQTGAVARCYSLSSSPHVDEELAVTVKRTAGGYASNWLCDNAAPGTRFEVLVPAGTFTPGSLDADFLLFAAGSGITPVMSILKSALSQGSGRVVLVYANRDSASVIFASQLARLGAAHPGRLHLLHWLEVLQGLPSSAQLQAFAEPYSGYDAFVCGPPPFMRAVSEALRAVGFHSDRLHLEVYNSLSQDPFAEVPPVAAESGDPDGAEHSQASVELDGEIYELSWPADRTLIDVMLANGIDAPYSCREGECGACTCLVREGTVRMMSEDALDPADIAEGYALGCQALPTSRRLSIVF